MIKPLVTYFGLWGVCLAQGIFTSNNEILLDRIFRDREINPSQFIVINKTRFVFMDTDSRELFLVDEGNLITATSGFGQGSDSFVEPVDLERNNLKIWVCDFSENRIQQFDFQLNYIGSVEIHPEKYSPFYPELMVVDPLGPAVVYSSLYNIIWKIGEQGLPFIDLNPYSNYTDCITDMAMNELGDMAVLSICESKIFLFNQFGLLIKIIKYEINNPIKIFSVNKKWYIVNGEGQMEIIQKENIITLPLVSEETVLDVDAYFNTLYFLTTKKVFLLTDY